MDPIEALAGALRRGDRRALARAVTLVESTRSDHRRDAERLIEAVLPQSGGATRIGVTGPPGAGKSTFIERFGLDGIASGRRVAVLAVDPASKRGGGAILGDKTRMPELARLPQAFIRPSSAGGHAGGIARGTREAILLCEAAGFDSVIIETVGVGQSETAVADLADIFLLILPPASGDELQGIKRGIVELADLILVNKADGVFAQAAQSTAADYANARRLMRPAIPGWDAPVRAVSALTGAGIAAIWDEVARFRTLLEELGLWSRRRAERARAALWSEIGAGLVERLRNDAATAARIGPLEDAVSAGRRTPAAAARLLLEGFFADRR